MSEVYEDLTIPTDIGVITSGDINITGSISGQIITVNSGATVSLPATQVVKVSGEQIVTSKNGASVTLFSGYGATNTVVVSGFGFLQHERATIVLEHLGGGSGANYSVIGHALSGAVKYTITSGAIYSGDVVAETISDPYEWLDIGIDNTQDNFSGLVTVAVVRR